LPSGVRRQRVQATILADLVKAISSPAISSPGEPRVSGQRVVDPVDGHDSPDRHTQDRHTQDRHPDEPAEL
jgi:hypothetical protein